MIEVKRASELGENSKKKISEIFVDGFGKHLTAFSKDYKKLADAFEHMFVLDVFFVAVIDGEIAGITACTDGKISCINHNKKELIKHLGFLKGTFANIIFKREFQKPAIKTGDRIASVEFVATASKYKGKGVATEIMNYLFALPQYDEYILEVADTNTNAVNLYKKLGYKEFHRIKQKHSKISGINYLVYMKYTK
jgi:ribosomal protein S18 acetylase RimI-like enzyme